MKYSGNHVTIVRDAHFHIPRQAMEWELPILQEIFGEGQVEIGEPYEKELGEVDLASEKTRLERFYKVEEDSKIPFVEVVYGRGQQCIRNLGKAIENAAVKERAKPGPKPKAEAA